MQNTDMYPRRRKPNEGFAIVERYRELRISGRDIKVKMEELHWHIVQKLNKDSTI